MRPSDAPSGSPSPVLTSEGRVASLEAAEPASDRYRGIPLGVEGAWPAQALMQDIRVA
jgi:hypothetical protein